MKHATSIALHDYWQGCHDRHAVPAGSIRAAELAPILPSLFLVDPNVAAGMVFRFCGANIARRYGRDLCEESFLTLWSIEDRGSLERHLAVSARQSTGLLAGVLGETVGGGFTAFEMLLLPLRGETGIAGTIGSMERIGGHEERNRIRARLVSQSLRSLRLLPAAERLPSHSLVPASPIGGRDAPFRRRYGHLSIVIGGK